MEQITGKIVSINISERKGTVKLPVANAEISNYGIKTDAHYAFGIRQVSLLDKESIDKFSAEAGRQIDFGSFAENFTVEGIDFSKIKVLDKFLINDSVLEVSQIGKKCHGDNCSIYKEVGKCIMPTQGIFARVKKIGSATTGDNIIFSPKVFNIKIITLSDRASKGIYEDRSGERIKDIIEKHFQSIGRFYNVEKILISDNKRKLKQLLQQFKQDKVDLVITTGGTGIGSRDITPEVVNDLLTKEIPGIMDMIRLKYSSVNLNALVSRSIAGLINKTIIFCLPGSVKAVEEYMNELVNFVEHLIYMVNDLDKH